MVGAGFSSEPTNIAGSIGRRSCCTTVTSPQPEGIVWRAKRSHTSSIPTRDEVLLWRHCRRHSNRRNRAPFFQKGVRFPDKIPATLPCGAGHQSCRPARSEDRTGCGTGSRPRLADETDHSGESLLHKEGVRLFRWQASSLPADPMLSRWGTTCMFFSSLFLLSGV